MNRREVLLVVGIVLLGGGCLTLALLWKGEQDRAVRLEGELAAARTAKAPASRPRVRVVPPTLPSRPQPPSKPRPVEPKPSVPPAVDGGATAPLIVVPTTPAEILAWIKAEHEDEEEAGRVQEELQARLKADAALRNDLIALLSSTTDPEELTALAQLLAEALGEQAFPTLERVYTSKTDPALRRAALFMIGALGTETSRRYVLDVLRTAHSDEGRIAAVEALGYPWGARESEARQVVVALQELMSSREASTRLDGAVALLSWAHRPEHAAMTADYLASETDSDARYTVLQYLDGHALARDPKVFQTVRRIFEDPGAALELRQAAANVLADTLVVDDDLSKAIERFWDE